MMMNLIMSRPFDRQPCWKKMVKTFLNRFLAFVTIHKIMNPLLYKKKSFFCMCDEIQNQFFLDYDFHFFDQSTNLRS